MSKFGTLARAFSVGRKRRTPDFLILLPIHRPPHLLKFAMCSVFQQTEQDFELHLIGDGAPDETVQELKSLARQHKSVTAHVFAKGERYGEAYRDPIIRESRAKFVCQIADDDIWFPNHLAEIGSLLNGCDFGHTIQTDAAPGGRLLPHLGDITDPRIASRMIDEKFNLFGPTAAGYRTEAYLKLEDGWTAAPQDIWSDLHMWRKFLRHDAVRCASRFSFTNLRIAATRHEELSIDEREHINMDWWQRVSNPVVLDQLIQSLTKHSLLRSDNAWLEHI